MPEQRIAKRNAVVITISAFAVVVFITLFVVFSIKTSRERDAIREELRTAVASLAAVNLKTAQAVLADCRRTNVTRMQSNTQIRKPLKEMLGYIVTVVGDSLNRQSRAGQPIPNLERTLKFKARFEGFYSRVTLLKQVDCDGP